MAFQMLCLRKPPFAIPTFLREEAPVPVLDWTDRHHLRSVVLVWGQLIRGHRLTGTVHSITMTPRDSERLSMCPCTPDERKGGISSSEEGPIAGAVEGGVGRGEVLEGEKERRGEREKGRERAGSGCRIDRWIREVEVKTKSGSSGWGGGVRFPLGSGGAGRPTWQLGSRAARPAEGAALQRNLRVLFSRRSGVKWILGSSDK
jgi:hypothetical protein